MAFKAINNIVGPNRLILTLLVYSIYQQITKYDLLSLLVAQQALAIKKAIAEVQKLSAKRQVNNAFNAKNGPNTTTIYKLVLNFKVLVQREGNTS